MPVESKLPLASCDSLPRFLFPHVCLGNLCPRYGSPTDFSALTVPKLQQVGCYFLSTTYKQKRRMLQISECNLLHTSNKSLPQDRPESQSRRQFRLTTKRSNLQFRIGRGNLATNEKT